MAKVRIIAVPVVMSIDFMHFLIIFVERLEIYFLKTGSMGFNSCCTNLSEMKSTHQIFYLLLCSETSTHIFMLA